jgi:outer membrane receptor protein involved in Fe transport
LPGTPACAAGANFDVTTPGGYGPYNTVQPQFSSVALQDQWRPSDRWLLNFGVRYENYTYDLANMDTPEFTFWFSQARNSFCYDPGTGQPVLVPVTPNTPPSQAGPVVNPNTLAGQQAGLCYQAGTLNPLVAPSGKQAQHPFDFTNLGQSNQSYTLFSPRVSGTYSLDPDTVVRFNVGRFSEPAQVAYAQYSNLSGFGAAKTDFQYFYGLGFNTPEHNNPPQTSNNYDMSFEKHLKGTDWSFKISPFFRDTQNQVVTVSLGGTFASGINAAQQLTSGVEVAIQKGDPSRNGLSGQLSYTYTNAKQRFYTLSNGSNTIDALNTYIRAYNGLTEFCAMHAGSSQCPTGVGAASPCYNPASPTGPNQSNAPVACGANPGKSGFVINPYYNQAAQPLFDRNGWYPI